MADKVIPVPISRRVNPEHHQPTAPRPQDYLPADPEREWPPTAVAYLSFIEEHAQGVLDQTYVTNTQLRRIVDELERPQHEERRRRQPLSWTAVMLAVWFGILLALMTLALAFAIGFYVTGRLDDGAPKGGSTSHTYTEEI